MSESENAIREFLAQHSIAVAGVSSTRDTPANFIYRKLRDAGYHVFPVSGTRAVFDDVPCYPSLAQIEQSVDGVVIVTSPTNAEKIIDECIGLGIKRIWLHNMLGTEIRWGKNLSARMTSVSDAGLKKAREAGIAVIPGDCPMQHVAPVDGWHRCIHWVADAVGNHG